MNAAERAAALAKIAEASSTAGGNPIRDGKGVAEVVRMSLFESKGEQGLVFVAEFKVVSSEKIPVISILTGEKLDVEPNAQGTTFSVVCTKLMEKKQPGAGAAKGVFEGLLGAAYSSLGAQEQIEMMNEAVEEEGEDAQPLKGFRVGYETYRYVTKKNKKELVLPRWTTMQNSPEDVAARRDS